MSKESLVKGALVLGVAGIIVKFMGAIFRLPLANMISDVGMANYSPAYYIYSFFLILATSGIPVAISKMVSESRAVGNHYQAHKIFTLANGLMATIGFVSFVILFSMADSISRLIGNPQAALAMRAISPSLIIVPIMAAFRGYFQGMQNMKPTAISQVIEQFFRMLIGLSMAYFLYHMTYGSYLADNFDSYERGAAGANFGATAGAIGGLVMILLIYFMSRKAIILRVSETESMGAYNASAILKRILVIAVPITVGAAIMPIINLVDVAMVVERLQSGAGFTFDEAKSLYGQLSGFVGPLINFPQVLTQAVAMSLVPVVAEAYKLKDDHKLHSNISLGLRITMILAFPSAIGLLVLSRPILVMLYPRQLESAVNAAPVLGIMAIGVVFLATVQTLSGVLQGVSRQLVPVKNLVIGVCFKIIITYILTGIPYINVRGAAVGTVVAYMVAAILNVRDMMKYTGTKIDILKTFIRPFIAASVMGIIVKVSYITIFTFISSNFIATLLAVILGGVSYGIMIVITGTMDIEELYMIPKGDKLAKIARKILRK